MQSFAGRYRQGCLSKCQTGDFLSFYGPAEANWQQIFQILSSRELCVAHKVFFKVLKMSCTRISILVVRRFFLWLCNTCAGIGRHTTDSYLQVHKSQYFKKLTPMLITSCAKKSEHLLRPCLALFSCSPPLKQAYNRMQLTVHPVLETKDPR